MVFVSCLRWYWLCFCCHYIYIYMRICIYVYMYLCNWTFMCPMYWDVAGGDVGAQAGAHADARILGPQIVTGI